MLFINVLKSNIHILAAAILIIDLNFFLQFYSNYYDTQNMINVFDIAYFLDI